MTDTLLSFVVPAVPTLYALMGAIVGWQELAWWRADR